MVYRLQLGLAHVDSNGAAQSTCVLFGGDYELNHGAAWEAIIVAAERKLDPMYDCG